MADLAGGWELSEAVRRFLPTACLKLALLLGERCAATDPGGTPRAVFTWVSIVSTLSERKMK